MCYAYYVFSCSAFGEFGIFFYYYYLQSTLQTWYCIMYSVSNDDVDGWKVKYYYLRARVCCGKMCIREKMSNNLMFMKVVKNEENWL